jgi:ribulose-5-phosphate 4-epimerase/fuculose-1-phosphate aldolase
MPGEEAMLFLSASGTRETRYEFATLCADTPLAPTVLHANIYRIRADVGAIMLGGGDFSWALSEFCGALPSLFDEQARHLGIMRVAATAAPADLSVALHGGGNSLLVGSLPVCLGVNCLRMIFNAELLEKCAKAYVLAKAAGDGVKQLPWWVRRIANRRLLRDERRAAQRFALGLIPEEARGY